MKKKGEEFELLLNFVIPVEKQSEYMLKKVHGDNGCELLRSFDTLMKKGFRYQNISSLRRKGWRPWIEWAGQTYPQCASHRNEKLFNTENPSKSYWNYPFRHVTECRNHTWYITVQKDQEVVLWNRIRQKVNRSPSYKAVWLSWRVSVAGKEDFNILISYWKCNYFITWGRWHLTNQNYKWNRPNQTCYDFGRPISCIDAEQWLRLRFDSVIESDSNSGLSVRGCKSRNGWRRRRFY